MIYDELEARELMMNRFRKLLAEVMRGQTARNSFNAWEIELMLDMQTCELEPRRRTEILKQYQRAVEKQLAVGPGPPMKLSDFLVIRARRSS